MYTSRPFSSICYLDPFPKLQELADKRQISFAAAIQHQPEDDETKYHWHVLVVPNKRIDTDALRDLFEVPNDDPKLPSWKWMPCRNSSFQDWYLYSMHHSGYLALKNQSRRFHYQREDFQCTDELFFKDCIDQIDWSKINLMGQIIAAVKIGTSLPEIFEKYPIPLNAFSSVERLWKVVSFDSTYRNDRVNHEASAFTMIDTPEGLVDPMTGIVN